MIPYDKQRLTQVVIPSIEEEIENYKRWMKECQECITARKKQLEQLQASIDDEEQMIWTYQLGICQCQMSLLKLKEESNMDKLIKKVEKDVKDNKKKKAEKDIKVLKKADKKFDKKLTKAGVKH